MGHDVIVVGCGGVGGAALHHLARRGVKVLGLDRFPVGHDRGSSHGHTRIIRLAYFEHPEYVPLLQRAYALWEQLADEAGQVLLTRTGLLQVGPPDGEVVPGVLRSAEQHGLGVERFASDEAKAAFPMFRFEDGEVAVHEHDAGVLHVEACVTAHARLAEQHGAELRTGVAVHGLDATSDGVVVRTDDGVFTADRVVVAAGAWSAGLLGRFGMPLQVLRKHVHWFADDAAAYRVSGTPTFLFERANGIFYGFPAIDDLGVKVAEHTGGTVIEDPDDLGRADDPVARLRTAAFAKARLSELGARVTRHEVCMYTMSPDGHFVVDEHPGLPGVLFAAGLSGHGFKFAPVLGEALADLATTGGTGLPLEFLRIRG